MMRQEVSVGTYTILAGARYGDALQIRHVSIVQTKYIIVMTYGA